MNMHEQWMLEEAKSRQAEFHRRADQDRVISRNGRSHGLRVAIAGGLRSVGRGILQLAKELDMGDLQPQRVQGCRDEAPC